MEKYNILVWSEEIGKFAKDIMEKGGCNMISTVIILGSELKIGDLKILQEIKNLNYEIDNECASRDLSEVFLLGRCYEQSKNGTVIGLCGFAPLYKTTMETAKLLNIPISNWTSLRTKSTSQKTVSTKTTNSKKTNTKSKEETNVKIASNIKGVTNIIKKSSLSIKDKEFFLLEENIKLIKEAINNASDAKIGLPMQLQIRLGKARTEQLSDLLENLFNEKE